MRLTAHRAHTPTPRPGFDRAPRANRAPCASPRAVIFAVAVALGLSALNANSISGTAWAQGTAPTITSADTTTFLQGKPGTFKVTTTGSPAPKLSISGTDVPPWLTFTDNGDGTATMSGTPPVGEGGTYPFTITANNSVGPPVTQSFTLLIGQAPMFTSGNLVSGTVGQFLDFQITASGVPAPVISLEAGSLPPGISLVPGIGGRAELYGTPLPGADGDDAPYFAAVNGVSPNALQQIAIEIEKPTGYTVNSNADDSGSAANAANCPLDEVLGRAHRLSAAASTSSMCTLPDALAAAAAAGGPVLITFDPTVFTGPTTLTYQYPLMIQAPITVQGLTTGSGATQTNLITISGNNFENVFMVFSSNGGSELTNLNITGGKGGANGGGAIYNSGTLSVINCNIFNNTAPGSGLGGAIYNLFSLTVIGSTISGNSAGSGGGIYNVAEAQIQSSTIVGNTAGGGIYNAGSLNITDSTISNNVNLEPGGGLFNTNVGTLVPEDDIISGNTAPSGAGIYGGSATTFTYASHNVYWNNLDTPGGAEDDCDNCRWNLNPVSATADPTLPLANNGGPTQTMMPQPGSQAICAGFVSPDSPGDLTDQRGFPNINTTYAGFSPQTPCIDAGAVQTNYTSVGFIQQPTDTLTNNAITPAPTVQVLETNTLLTTNNTDAVNGIAIPLTYSGGSDSITGSLTETTMNGVATFSGLTPTAVASDVNLSASLTITPPGLPQAATLTADSNSFNVGSGTPEITSAATTTIIVGTAGSFTVTATGIPTPTLSEAGSLPTGITFTDNGNGTATIAGTPAAGTAGKYPIAITAINGVSPNAVQNFSLVVSKATPSITWAPPAAITYGTALSSTQLDATASVAGAFTYTPASGAVLNAGSQTLSATFAPTDAADYATATAMVSLTVNKASQTIAFTAPASPVAFSPSLQIALVATGGASGNPVVFTLDSTSTATGMITGDTLTVTGLGNLVIDANQAGSSNYAAAAQVQQTVVVSQQAQTITFANPGTQTVGTPLTLTATASSALTVSFASTTTSVCTVSGTTAAFAAAGTCTIQATQAGNGTFAAAPPVSQSFTVNAVPATFVSISFAADTLTVNSGSSVSTTVTLAPQNGFTGQVSFSCTGLPQGDTCTFSPNPVDVSAGGSATVNLTVNTGSTTAALQPKTVVLIPAASLAIGLCFFVFGKRSRRLLVILVAVSIAGTYLIAGCGGSSSKTTTVTIVAASGGVQNSATFMLVVKK